MTPKRQAATFGYYRSPEDRKRFPYSAENRPLSGDSGKFIASVYSILGSSDLKRGGIVDISRFEQDLTILGTDQRSVLLGPFNADLNGDGAADIVNGDGAADIVVADDFEPSGASFSTSGPPAHVIFGGSIMPPPVSSASAGPNQIVVIRKGTRSDAFELDL